LKRLGQQRHPIETGGILIGFRDGVHVRVKDALEVHDPTAPHTSYTLRAKPRETALTRYLQSLPPNSLMGYVGDWHTHPADAEPSGTDRSQFLRDSFKAADILAMIVMIKTANGWRPEGLLASSPGRVQTVRLKVIQPKGSSGKGHAAGAGKDGST
jgi:integrative and conjugative element protein (TIGR02256 family)